MRILFIFPRNNHYDPETVREQPSGGTEKCVIFLGEALRKLGHEVEWITTPDNLRSYQGNPDVVITQVAELLESFPNARKIWWTHHFSDQPVIQANAAFARCFADHVVTLSQCHAADLKSNLKIDSTTIGHGVWLSEVQPGDKDPYRLIYASTPFRGLEKIPALFRKIKAEEPRATIAICSSMATYGEPEKDKQYQRIFDELTEIPGVELKGSLNQAQLYAEYARASIFFYPCIWPETYCLALDEAMAHECYPIVERVGALPERVDMDVKGVSVFEDLMHVFKGLPILQHFRPKDWLDIGKQWERDVLA